MTFGAIKTLDNKFIEYNVIEGIYLVLLEVAAELVLPGEVLNEPLGDAVIESFEKFIRSTVDTTNGPGLNPPPNQP